MKENQRKEELSEKQALDDKITTFKKKVESSEDLNDNLQELSEHLAEFTKATSCYIGKIAKPIKGISQGMQDDEDEDAHLVNGAKPEIQFKYASKGAEFMVGQVLQQDQGLSYNLFQEPAKAGDPEEPFIIPENKENGIPKHLIIKEVVKEPKIHFYKVPRLGSYMAVKLEYESCLFEKAFDEAVSDFINVRDKNLGVDEQKLED